jgi:dipeptidyl aminopeptidase/acylaminoacyl peptidase
MARPGVSDPEDPTPVRHRLRQEVFMHNIRTQVALLCLVAVSCVASPGVPAQSAYQKPPKAIQDVLDAPANPTVLSISPARDRLLLATAARYISIAELAEPGVRLAGLRVNPKTNGPGRARPRIAALLLKSIADGKETTIALPPNADPGLFRWSPDGKRFALTNTTSDGIELWIGDSATGRLRPMGVKINAVHGEPIQWLPDGETLLVQTVVADRGRAPVAPKVPAGPVVLENFGKATPARTYQGLLKSPHDERLLDYYATSRLALVGAGDGKLAPLGKPGIFALVRASPDGNYLLVATVHRPYSYLHTISAFPKEVEVWDRGGRMVHKLASLPLADRVPIEGVATGPRAYSWRPTEPATLVWVEALDGGDPRKTVPHRDAVKMLRAPFGGPPIELMKTEHRYDAITWGEKDALVLIKDYDRKRRWTRTFMLDADRPESAPKVVWSRSTQDLYDAPGVPVMKALPNGRSVMHQHGDEVFLSGSGATPQGDRPFLARFDLKTAKTEQIFRSGEGSYERLVALLADDGSRFLTSYETQTAPPNYFVRTAQGEGKVAVTGFADPTPQLRGIRKELVRYKRKDGVDLSFTLYLPPDYRAGTPLPTILWAYPIEFTDAGVAGQVSGSPNRFTSFGGASHLFFALMGYAVLHNATMPVIGDPETVNDTYIAQIVSSAEAAIDKAVEMGVTDRARVGVGGHSYGAFMTANLLAHSRLFKAGIARSGAYNRTLTPFGFQRERRTFWEAPRMYIEVSPFVHAHKIKEPLLLMHGAADTNAGTHPIQSERMFEAVKGNGGNVRYVRLPLESHGYVARESIEHALWEMLEWADRHVKGERSAVSGPSGLTP